MASCRRPECTGSEHRAYRRYRRAEEYERSEMDGWESELFVVPMKWGHRPMGPRGGKGESDYGSVGGKDGGDSELRQRLNETAADSKAGERTAGNGVDLSRSPHRRRLSP